MVSKSFLRVRCPCGEKSPAIRRDVVDNRGWERDHLAIVCDHFIVRYDCYTRDSDGYFSKEDDEVTFELYGWCKGCHHSLTPVHSSASGYETVDDEGLLECSLCNQGPGYSVSHCAHGLQNTATWAISAAGIGAAIGSGAALASGGAVLVGAVVGAVTSGIPTLAGVATAEGQ